MSSRPSKNNGNCLGYFFVFAFIYYAYNKYGTVGFFRNILRVIVIGFLIWLAFFVISVIINVIHNSKSSNSASNTNNIQPSPDSNNNITPNDLNFSSPEITSFDKQRYKYYNDKFDYMTGKDFEEYCAHLLHEVGFLDVITTSASNDFGVDILAKYNNVLYAFQCKRYSSNVGVGAIQEISSGMKYYHANVGIVITNQHYTTQARELAFAVGIVLWDRDFLQKLIKASIAGTDLLPLMLGSNQP